MADTFDSLVVGSRFDPSGFAEGLNQSLGLYDSVAERISGNPIRINTEFDARALSADIVQASQLVRERLASSFQGLSDEAGTAAVAAADELQTQLFARLGGLRERLANAAISPEAFQKRAQLAAEFYTQEMNRLAANTAVLPPPRFDPQPFIQEVIRAADESRAELEASFDANRLGEAARLSARSAADELQVGLLQQLGGLAESVAAEIIDPAAFARQGEAALTAFAQSVNTMVTRPITIPLQFDAADFTAEVIAVADESRQALLQMINARELSAEAAAAATATADALQQTLFNRLADLRVELAQELISPVEFERQGDVALQAFSQEMIAQARTLRPIPIQVQVERSANDNFISDDDLRKMQAFSGEMGQLGGAGGRGVNSLAELENQIRALKGDEAAGITTNEEYAISLAEIRAEAVRLREDGLVSNQQSLTAYNRILRDTEGRTKESAVALRQMRLGAAQLAVQALGTTGAVGQLAQGLIIFAGGSGLVVGVALGIAAIVGAYNLMTGAAAKAREEQDKLADALHKRLDVGTGTGADRDTADLQKEIAGAEQRRAIAAASIAKTMDALKTDLNEQFFREADIINLNRQHSKELKAQFDIDQGRLLLQQKLFDAEQKNFATVNQARRAQTQSLSDFAAGQFQIVGAGLQLNNAHRSTALLLQQQLGIADDLSHTDAERLRALNTYKAGVNEITAGLLRQITASQAAGNIQLQLVQRLRQRSEQVDAPITVRADVTQAENGLQRLRAEYTSQIETLRGLEGRYARNRDAVVAWAAKRQELEQLRHAIDDVMQSAGGRELEQAEGNLQQFIDRLGRLTPNQLEVLIPVHFDDTAAFADLQNIQTQLQRRLDSFTAAGVAPPQELVQAFNTISQEIQTALTAPIEALNRSAALVQQRMEGLRSFSDAIAAGQELQTGNPETTINQQFRLLQTLQPVLDSLRERYALITAEIEREGGPLKANIDLIQTQAQLLQQINATRVDTTPTFEASVTAPLQQAAQDFITASNRLDIAIATGTTDEKQKAQGALDAAADRMDQLKRDTLELAQHLNLDSRTTNALVNGIADAYQRAGREATKLSASQLRTIAGLSKVQSAVGFIHSLADAFGDADTKIIRILDHLGDVAGSIQNLITQGTSFGTVLGVATAGIGLAQSLFGPKESDRLLEENNTRLKELTSALDRRAIGAGGLAEAGAAVAFLQRINAGAQFAGAGAQGRVPQVTNELNQQLQQFGFNLEQLNQIAKSEGISLLDKEGRLSAARLEQFTQALGIDITALTTFGNTLADQQQASELAARLFNSGQDPASIFQRQLSVISQFSPEIAKQFAGLDLKNQPQVRAALQKMFSELDDGFFKAHPELFGGLTRDQFTQFLNQGADYLDSFNQAVADATNRIGDFNLPEGFRRAALAFQSANIGEFTPAATTVVQVPSAPVNAQAQAAPSTSVSVQKVEAVFQVSGDTNVDDLFDQFIQKLRDLGMQATGDSLTTVPV